TDVGAPRKEMKLSLVNYSVAGTAPLLSRLGLFRKRCRIMALDRKPIRAATVMERFLRRYRIHRDSPLLLLPLALLLAGALAAQTADHPITTLPYTPSLDIPSMDQSV